MDTLQKEIFSKVCFDRIPRERCVDVTAYRHLVRDNVWTEAINTALREHHCVYIPNMGTEIYLDDSIIMDDNDALVVDRQQVIALVENASVCMVRNARIVTGNDCPVDRANCNRNIYVEGGIWSPSMKSGNATLYSSKENHIVGIFSIMVFSNIENLTIRDLTYNDSGSYALQISNCKGFLVEDISYLEYKKDGVHLNGPLQYGVIRNLDGCSLKDDMVALNAWDWNTSAYTFGTIEKIYVENLNGNNNEIRLLPGYKRFSDGTRVTCDVRDCIFKDVACAYTFKMYNQPHWRQAFSDYVDHSDGVGHIENVYFENINFPNVKNVGLADVKLNAIYECGCHVKNIHFRNIALNLDKEHYMQSGMKLVAVGPLSATWTGHFPNEPEKWGELMSPDDICEGAQLHFENITFAGEKAERLEEVLREVHLTVNPDYPNTLPKGGTGYGCIDWDSCTIR